MMSAENVRKELVRIQLERCDASIKSLVNSDSFKIDLVHTTRVVIGHTPLLDETRTTLEKLGWNIDEEYQNYDREYVIKLSAIKVTQKGSL